MPSIKQAEDYLRDAISYADDVTTGEIPANVYIRKSCARFLADLDQDDKKFPYTFDLKKAWRACGFLEALPHTKGEWAARRERIRLQPWQVFIYANLFGWVKKSDNRRRYRRALVLVPRKNGKSLIAGGVGNYMFAADGEYGAEVYSGATSLDQAMEVFRPAKQMVERTPRLKNRFGIETHARSMVIPANGARFSPVVGKPGDGASPSCALVDEFHEHPTAELYETMRTGMGARGQPLMLAISTAGDNIAGPCFDAMIEAQKELDGVIEDPGLFSALYGLDPEDDWTEPAMLAKANPNIGVSVSREWLESELASAMQNPKRQATFQIKHCNRWVGSRQQFFNVENWRAAGDEDLKLDQYAGRDCWLALDLASKQDVAAIVMLFPPDERGKYAAFGRFFVPEEGGFSSVNADNYRAWAKDGRLIVTDGARIDQERIYDEIKAALARFKVRQVLYDPWGAHGLISRLTAEGAPCVEYRQNVQNFSEPMKELSALIDDGGFVHDDDPVLTWMLSNVVSTVDSQDRVYPRREAREAKIDGAVALIMAMGGALADEAAGYAQREPVVFVA